MAVASTLVLSACIGGKGQPSVFGVTLPPADNHDTFAHYSKEMIASSQYLTAAKEDFNQANGSGVLVGMVDTKFDASALRNRANVSQYHADINRAEITKHKDLDDKGNNHGSDMIKMAMEQAPQAAYETVGDGLKVGVNSHIGIQTLSKLHDKGAKYTVINGSYASGVNTKSNDMVQIEAEYRQKDYDYWAKEQNKLFKKMGALFVTGAGNSPYPHPSLDKLAPVFDPEVADNMLVVAGYEKNKHALNDCGITKDHCLVADPFFVDRVDANGQVWSSEGSSSSTARTSGVAARVASRYDWLTPKQLKDVLLHTATDLGEKGVDWVYGHGLLNPERATRGFARFDQAAQNNVLMVEGNKKAYFLDNDIVGQGGVTKRGRDTLVVNGHNTYSGNTVIEQGEWVANGQAPHSAHHVKEGRLTVGDIAKVQLKSVDVENKGTLNVEAGDLAVEQLRSKGRIEQAIGTHIVAEGVANIDNSVYTITGTKKGYVTKKGQTEQLIESKSNQFSAKNTSIQFANTQVGELINNQVYNTSSGLAVKTHREEIGKVVKNKANFTGRDKIVDATEMLLANLDLSHEVKKGAFYATKDNIKQELGYTANGNPTPSKMNQLASKLMETQNVNGLMFQLNPHSAVLLDKAATDQQAKGAVDVYQKTKQSGQVWVDASAAQEKLHGHGFDAQVKTFDEKVGASTSTPDNKHHLAVQLGAQQLSLNEQFGVDEKQASVKGFGVDIAYRHQLDNGLNIGSSLSAARLRDKQTNSTGTLNTVGIYADKTVNINDKFAITPSVYAQYSRGSGFNHQVHQLSEVQNLSNKAYHLGSQLRFDWKLGETGIWRVFSALGIKRTNGRFDFTSLLGGIPVQQNGRYQDTIYSVSLGVNAQVTPNIAVQTSAGYEKGEHTKIKRADGSLSVKF